MADNSEGKSLQTTSLDRDKVNDTAAWRLMMRIAPAQIDVMAYNPHQDGSLIMHSVPLADANLNSIEEAVYENTFLLKEFARIDVIFASSAFMLLPSDVTEDESRQLMEDAFPDAPTNVIEDNVSPSIKLTYSVDAALEGFVRRTFFNARVHHCLTPLIQYFMNGVRGNALRMCVNVNRDSIDVIAFDHNRLLLANSFKKVTVEDALYYILSVRDLLFKEQLAQGRGVEIVISGPPAKRAELIPVLSRYASPVVPVIFPSAMFNAGNESMNAPFDLTLTSLCE